jgi:hypothetical protein
MTFKEFINLNEEGDGMFYTPGPQYPPAFGSPSEGPCRGAGRPKNAGGGAPMPQAAQPAMMKKHMKKK